jgi:RHS repeat-associated protein
VQATDHVNNTSAWVEAGPVTVSAVTKYYYHGGERVAMRQGDVVYYLHSDHLGSTSLTTDQSGAPVAEIRYLPYGEERWITGTLVTDFTFTGQRAERGFGLMDYNARFYDPWLGRFISPDSIVHNPSNPNDLNRYSYGRNNPLKYIDPTGHQFLAAGLGEVVLLAGLAYLACEAYGYQYGWGPNAAENRQTLATAVNDVADQVGTAFTPPSVPSSNPDAFPLGSPPDPYSPPGVELDVPEWSGLPGVPLDQPDTGSRAIDFPLGEMPSLPTILQVTVGHHTVPRQILEDYLPPDVGNDPQVRGKKGAPNIWPIPEDVHKDIHQGSGGGPFNERWKEELNALGREPTVQDVLHIRNKLTKEFDIEKYRPR